MVGSLTIAILCVLLTINIYFARLFTGHAPAYGSGQAVINISRVESDRTRRCLRYHGTGRTDRVGSGPDFFFV